MSLLTLKIMSVDVNILMNARSLWSWISLFALIFWGLSLKQYDNPKSGGFRDTYTDYTMVGR